MNVFVLDNYDSFTYILVQYLGGLGADVTVRLNDQVAPTDVLELAPDAILISPGPGAPADAGISKDLIDHASGRIPILGVCLGHQVLAEAFGGRVVRADRIMHGKTSYVTHSEDGLFERIRNPVRCMRYHSLIVDSSAVPPVLTVTATTEEGEIMALAHTVHATWGVQFHPESIATRAGHKVMQNFLTLARTRAGV